MPVGYSGDEKKKKVVDAFWEWELDQVGYPDVDTNEGDFYSVSAMISCWSFQQDKIEKLQKESTKQKEYDKERIRDQVEIAENQRVEIEKLQKAVDVLMEMGEFYGDVNNWDHRRHGIHDMITCKDIKTLEKELVYGGKKARAALKQAKEILGE